MPELTILTPCFNRLEQIKKLIKSLNNQTVFNFQWLIIDDGSNDGTEQWFERLDKDSYHFKIDYFYKKNGGKHTALNYSHQYIQGKYVVIVDSDDILINKAVEVILDYWREYEHDKNIGSIIFQRGWLDNQQKFDNKINGIKESTFAEMANEGVSGDHCETFRTSLFTQENFPIYKNENFVAEGAMWYLLTKNYHVIYVDKVIYLSKYLEGGLTKSGRRLRVVNPNGSRWHARIFLDRDFCFKIRLKNSILFDTYSHFIGEKWSKAVENVPHSRLMLSIVWWPSYILYYLWNKKYGN